MIESEDSETTITVSNVVESEDSETTITVSNADSEPIHSCQQDPVGS